MKTLRTIAATAAIAAASIAAPVQAQARYMYMGEIFEFAGNFCPRDTLPTDGRMLVVEQNLPLFQILGTKYGGGSITNGRTPLKFGLPKMTVTSENGEEVFKCIVVIGIFPSRY